MEKVLQVENLYIKFKTEHGMLKAVDGVNFEMRESKILGTVGGSGYGKGVISRSILRLCNKKSFVYYTGNIRSHDEGLFMLSEKRMESMRSAGISMVF